MAKNIKYIITQEDKYYVSQCLNVDVSSFGKTIEEAIDNLKEALELYYVDNHEYNVVHDARIGHLVIN